MIQDFKPICGRTPRVSVGAIRGMIACLIGELAIVMSLWFCHEVWISYISK